MVWIGRDDDGKLADGETGGRLAAPVVRDFLDAVGPALALSEPPVPTDGVTVVPSDPLTGLPAKGGIPEIVRTETLRGETDGDVARLSSPGNAQVAEAAPARRRPRRRAPEAVAAPRAEAPVDDGPGALEAEPP